MTLAYLFPGQGSQVPGMLHALPDRRVVRDTLAEASDVLGRDVLELDDEKTLESTVSTQIAIYVAGTAVSRALADEGIRPKAVAGLSVGAYAAATAAGALPFRDGVRLVHLRSSLMESQFTTGYGLAAVVGLDEAQVSDLVERAFDPFHPVYVGNLNAPRQIVVAGALPGVDKVVDLALAAGCKKAERLAVRVPSHCPLLQDVADVLLKEVATLEPSQVVAQYITNRRARGSRILDKIREDFATNIAHPVRWHDSTQILVEMGTTMFVEPNPGRVLSGLAREAFPAVSVLTASETRFETLVDQVSRHLAELDG